MQRTGYTSSWVVTSLLNNILLYILSDAANNESTKDLKYSTLKIIDIKDLCQVFITSLLWVSVCLFHPTNLELG